jgi:hypothetical protein
MEDQHRGYYDDDYLPAQRRVRPHYRTLTPDQRVTSRRSGRDLFRRDRSRRTASRSQAPR